jgi:hypothetical protein
MVDSSIGSFSELIFLYVFIGFYLVVIGVVISILLAIVALINKKPVWVYVRWPLIITAAVFLSLLFLKR